MDRDTRSVAGTLVKSCEGSRFVRLHSNSNLSEMVFSVYCPKVDGKPIEVLQVMLCADDHLIIEYVHV